MQVETQHERGKATHARKAFDSTLLCCRLTPHPVAINPDSPPKKVKPACFNRHTTATHLTFDPKTGTIQRIPTRDQDGGAAMSLEFLQYESHWPRRPKRFLR